MFQLYLAATVANLTLVAAKAGMTGETGSGPSSGNVLITGAVNSAATTDTAWLRQIWTLTLIASALLPHYPLRNKGFPSEFLWGVRMCPLLTTAMLEVGYSLLWV